MKSRPESGFMQSWAWAGFKAAQGQRVLRLGVFDGGRLAGGAMVYAADSALSPLLLPHGPVLPWGEPAKAEAMLGLLRDRLAAEAGPDGAPLARLEPLLEAPPPFVAALPRSPLDLVPTPTLLVPCAGPDEELLGAMRQKGRYNVRLALRKGVEAFQVPAAEGLGEFYGLFELTCARHGFDGEPPAFFEGLFSALGASGPARLYLARLQGMTLAAAVAVFYGGRATYLYGASAPFARSAMAPYALHWRIMRDARAAGCSVYDLYGIAPEGRPDHAYARFTPFKLNFGGRRSETCGGRDLYFYPRLARLLAGALAKGKGACNV